MPQFDVLLFLKVIVIGREMWLPVKHITRQQDWYAVVLRTHPEAVLVVDRSLMRGWTTARMLFPELGPENLAFRSLPEKELDAMPG